MTSALATTVPDRSSPRRFTLAILPRNWGEGVSDEDTHGPMAIIVERIFRLRLDERQTGGPHQGAQSVFEFRILAAGACHFVGGSDRHLGDGLRNRSKLGGGNVSAGAEQTRSLNADLGRNGGSQFRPSIDRSHKLRAIQADPLRFGGERAAGIFARRRTVGFAVPATFRFAAQRQFRKLKIGGYAVNSGWQKLQVAAQALLSSAQRFRRRTCASPQKQAHGSRERG